mmetsp:Transcript_14860/g.37921  ORF Transcript_14860/g.37921 Transcript_14860/m.37921 type:complete len:276 (-) Transcript_14860:156-983(-)
MSAQIADATCASSRRMLMSCRMRRFVILEGFSIIMVAKCELGTKIGRLSHLRTRVRYHPISSTVPSNWVPETDWIHSPIVNGRVTKIINPQKKLEMISLPAKPMATPPIPPNARTVLILTPTASKPKRTAIITATMVAIFEYTSIWVASANDSDVKRSLIFSIQLMINHVAAKMIPSSRAPWMKETTPVADSGREIASASAVPTTNTERNSSGRCMHSNTLCSYLVFPRFGSITPCSSRSVRLTPFLSSSTSTKTTAISQLSRTAVPRSYPAVSA